MSVSFKDGCLQFSDDIQDVHRNYIGRQDIKEVILPVDLKDMQYYRDTFLGNLLKKLLFKKAQQKFQLIFSKDFLMKMEKSIPHFTSVMD